MVNIMFADGLREGERICTRTLLIYFKIAIWLSEISEERGVLCSSFLEVCKSRCFLKHETPSGQARTDGFQLISVMLKYVFATAIDNCQPSSSQKLLNDYGSLITTHIYIFFARNQAVLIIVSDVLPYTNLEVNDFLIKMSTGLF